MHIFIVKLYNITTSCSIIMKEHIFKEYGQDRIIVREIIGSMALEATKRLDNFHLILIDSGELTVEVNYRTYHVGRHSTLHLQTNDIIRNINTTKDIKGCHIQFSSEFQTEMRTSRKSPINVQLKKEYPFQEFTEDQYEFLSVSIERLKAYIDDTTHLYQPIVVKNEVQNLLLNISDRRRKVHEITNDNSSRQDMILQSFKRLVDSHSHERHDVKWYADTLLITPDYLSKIIREHEGKSAREIINEKIISSAVYMMKQPGLSLKEISERLNFPDQSGFARFFKSNTGQSPKEFRKKLTGIETSED